MTDKELIKFYEFRTEYGPLYIYEKYKNNSIDGFNKEIPEIHEFFTGEKGIRGYNDISFLNGDCNFIAVDRNFEGLVRENYLRELQPYQFLEKVETFLDKKEEQIRHVYSIFELSKSNIKGNYSYYDKPIKSIDERNKESISVLKKHLK